MPQRDERFFWMHAEKAAPEHAGVIGEANRKFAGEWKPCPVSLTACVALEAASDRLWLFRLATLDETVARDFKKRIESHAARQGCNCRPSIPTPLVRGRIGGNGTWTDIGLHAVNDMYNGMLVTFTYWEGRGRQQPALLQEYEVASLAGEVRPAWGALACGCRGKGCPACKGSGCYGCFRAGCEECGGTGWKGFAAWGRGGYAIDYGSGVPLAC